MAQQMPLPLTVSCFSKIQIGFTFLVPDNRPLNGCVCVMAIIQVKLHYPAPLVKNWRIFLVQSFTANKPLLTATSAFRLVRREDTGVLLNIVIYAISIPYCASSSK